MQAQLEATLLRLGNRADGAVVYYDAGKLQVQQKLCWLLRPFFTKKPATDDEKTKALLPLFQQAISVPESCLPGLRYCHYHFEKLSSPSAAIVQVRDYCRGYFPPADFGRIPVDVLLMIKGCYALRRATKGLRQQISLAQVFQQQKILARAIDGEPIAVRRLVSYLDLQIQAATVFKNPQAIEAAKSTFSTFYPQATRDAKKLFWRAIFCSTQFDQFKKLLPLPCITDLPFKCNKHFSVPDGIAELIERSSELQSIEFQMGQFGPKETKLVQALKTCSKLTHLFVRRSKGLAEQEAALLEALPALNGLHALRLEGFSLYSASKALVRSFGSLRSLTVDVATGPDLMPTIGELADLEELAIATRLVFYERIRDEVAKLPKLKKLTLNVTDQGNCSCEIVTALLESLPNLTHFVLHNFIDGTPEDLEKLRLVIEKRGSLQTFSIRLNIDVPFTFAKTLLTKATLVRLGLVVNANSAFCQALTQNGSLCQLQELLYGQKDPDAALFGEIAKLPYLRSLTVQSQFTDVFAQQLAGAPLLRKFSFVSKRDFPEKLTHAGLASLFQIATLQKCKIWAPNQVDPNKAHASVKANLKLRSFELLQYESREVVKFRRGERVIEIRHLSKLILSEESVLRFVPDDTLTSQVKSRLLSL